MGNFGPSSQSPLPTNAVNSHANAFRFGGGRGDFQSDACLYSTFAIDQIAQTAKSSLVS